MDANAKNRLKMIILTLLTVFLLLTTAYFYYVNRVESEKTLKKEAYMATVAIKYISIRAYYMHRAYANYTGDMEEFKIKLRYDRQEVITYLNFSISVLEDARKRCDSLGLSHLGLDNNIAAYKKLRDFLLKNWGNTSKVIPVTEYLVTHYDNFEALFFDLSDAECCFDYNYDDSELIEEALKHAPA